MDCPFCYPEREGSLVILPDTHQEFYLVEKTDDGTKKWFYCTNCKGVFCRDKVRQIWQLSAETYTEFVKRGFIKDQLQE
jgi:hypothetical protein